MDLSVIIVSWNVRDLLDRCLRSVDASLRDEAVDYEIWVVDNASVDGSADMVQERYPRVHLMRNPDNRGFAAANNQATADARGRYLLLLNPDTEVQGGAIAALCHYLDRSPQVGMVGPRLLYPDGSFQQSAFRFPSLWQAFFDFFPLHHRLIDSSLNGRYPRSRYASGQPFVVDHPLGACMMVRREVVEQVGTLDPGYFIYCEEIDWAMRIKRAGWQICCVPAAAVVHHAGQSTRQVSARMFVALWRSRFRLFDRHYGPGYNWAVRWIVRAGVKRREREMLRLKEQGMLSQAELDEQLAACAEVRRIAGA